MEIWKKHIIQGNQFFDQNNNSEAIKHYRLAVERAQQLFPCWLIPNEAVAAILVSYHNLGDLYLRQNQLREGLECYQKAYHTLESALKNEQDEERQTALAKGASCAYTNLMATQKKLNYANLVTPLSTTTDISPSPKG